MGRAGHIDISLMLAVLALAALPGCQKSGGPERDAVARTELDIRLSVDGTAAVSGSETKSVVSGTTLKESGRTYGIIACEHEDVPGEYRIYDADNANLGGNIQAWYGNYNSKGTGWWYSYQASAGSRFRPLFFVTDDPSRHMDIYAYAPWKSGVTIESGCAYNITSLAESDLPDLLYATYEDAGGVPTNRDIVIDNGPAVPVNINFHHALSRIVFHFKLANAQNTGLDGQHAITLRQINLQKSAASSTPLYTQGSMDLLTGAASPMGSSRNEQIITYGTGQSISQDNAWKIFNMLVQPIEYQQDGDFSFMFYFNGNGFAQALNYRYEIKRSDILHDDGTTYGFKPGYCYHFYFIIDNYIHFQNVVIDTDWTLTDEIEIKI